VVKNNRKDHYTTADKDQDHSLFHIVARQEKRSYYQLSLGKINVLINGVSLMLTTKTNGGC
jgi:hypothetical protein